MGKFTSFWKSVGSFLSKTFSFIIEVLAMPAEKPWSKDTSYALVVCNDYKNDTHPVNTREWMKEIFSGCADKVEVLVDNEATGSAVLEKMEEGVKYKTFFFYIFSHGGKRSLFLCGKTLLAKYIWNVLRKSEGRIVGFFDACHSGSLLEDPDGIIREGEEEGDGNIADAIIEMFKEAELQSREEGNPESVPKTRLRLYSASKAETECFYVPKQYTLYSKAIYKTYNDTDEKTTYREFDELLAKNGTYHVSNKTYEYIEPQVATYGDDFSSYPRFR